MITIRNYSLDFAPMGSAPHGGDNPYSKRKSNSGDFPFGFLGNLLHDKDAVLILALILLLYADNCDKALIFALFYILI
ncbi:MAG: hypothetical protein MJ120_00705 [Clostridia bacterium]|nr:hypothetical protein [Clostridia bacterium]